MFTESERVGVRKWLGYPAVYTQSFSEVEQKMTSAQAISDGGTRADNSTELAVRSYLTSLATIETNKLALLEEMQAFKLEDLTVDPIRAVAGLNQIGRQYVGHISDALDTLPLRDVFSAASLGSSAGFRSGTG